MTRRNLLPVVTLAILLLIGTSRAQESRTVFAGRVTGGGVWGLVLAPPGDLSKAIEIPVDADGRFRDMVPVNTSGQYVLRTNPPCVPISLELDEDAKGTLAIVRADKPDEVLDLNAPGVSSIQTIKTGWAFSWNPGGGFSIATPSTTQTTRFDPRLSSVAEAGFGFGGGGRGLFGFGARSQIGGVLMTSGVCEAQP